MMVFLVTTFLDLGLRSMIIDGQAVTMVATLGGQPQVITFALDALLAVGVPVTELFVVHLADPAGRTKHSLACLAAEFADDRYQGRPLRYRLAPIRSGRVALPDVYDEADADTCWLGVNELIAGLKGRQRTLHICISGGRRMLGLLTMSAAMLHFGRSDKLWHIYTPSAWRSQANEGAMMHLPPDSGFRLIEVPMMPWGSYFPGLREGGLWSSKAADDVLAGPRTAMDEAEWQKCEAVISQLTDRQRLALNGLSRGVSPQRVAVEMGIGMKTLDTYKTAIYKECRAVWGELGSGRVDYRWLATKFGPYYHQRTTNTPPWNQS